MVQTESGSENSETTADEIFAVERLFQVLKLFKDSHFSELYTHDTLEFDGKYNEMINEEENDDDVDDHNENECSDITNHFTLEEMENIIQWVDQHSNAKLTTILHRFRKIKYTVAVKIDQPPKKRKMFDFYCSNERC